VALSACAIFRRAATLPNQYGQGVGNGSAGQLNFLVSAPSIADADFAVIERHRHEAVGVLKDVDGECADGTLPACLLRTPGSGYRVDESTNPPISALGYAAALS
jgi:hypothetical protein